MKNLEMLFGFSFLCAACAGPSGDVEPSETTVTGRPAIDLGEPTQPTNTEEPDIPTSDPTDVEPTYTESTIRTFPSGVDGVIIHGNERYEIQDGAAYRVAGASREKVEQLYDPQYAAKNYRKQGQTLFRVDPSSSQQFAISRVFEENFDGPSDVRKLIGPTYGWTGMTLQSPRAPTVEKYNKLSRAVINGGDFLDNRVELTTEQARSGTALKTLAMKPTGRMSVSKSSLDTGLVYLTEGDTLHFTGWFYIAEGMPTGLFDIESSYISSGPGLRLLLNERGVPRIELKWGVKPTYLAKGGQRLTPSKWHKMELISKLAANDQGTVVLKLNDEVIIKGYGQTFPTKDAIFDRLQVGVTANTGGRTTVYVDSVRLERN